MIGTLIGAAVVVVGLFCAISLANDLPPTRPLARLWRRHGSYVRWYVSSAPATFVYLAILAVTTWVLLGMPAELHRMFIAAQSTNLRHLTQDPVRVLVRSAFFVTSTELLVFSALFALLLAPAERWLGSARFIAVFVVGHVLATAGAALDVWVHIRYLHAPSSLWNVEDTGASYGFMTLAGLMVHRLRGRSRIALVVLLALVVLYGLLPHTGFTARGHAISVVVGVLLGPITRTAAVRRRTGSATGLVGLWRRATADGLS